jgi:alcohol dehydrogenase class IV
MTATTIDFVTTPRISLSAGALGQLPATFNDKGARSVLIVTDPGIVRAGIVDPVLTGLRKAGLSATVFDRVEADPPEHLVLAAVQLAGEAGVDAVLGLGGGSAMDTAKLVAYLRRSPCELESIYGIGLATDERLPLVLAPTTAGTGSEMTPISVVTTPSAEKKGVVSRRLLPDVALLDPNTTLGLPLAVTAATGIDAMVHAIEAYTSKLRKNPISDVLARQALSLLAANLGAVLERPRDIAPRQNMLLGSCLAGMAFANAPVAAVHALAYPLGGRHHVPHGLSNALMMLPVLRFNLSAAAGLYAELADVVGVPPGGAVGARADAFIARIATLIENCEGVPNRLRDVGVTEDQLDVLASDAMRQTRLLVNNPAAVTLADARRLYTEAF